MENRTELHEYFKHLRLGDKLPQAGWCVQGVIPYFPPSTCHPNRHPIPEMALLSLLDNR